MHPDHERYVKACEFPGNLDEIAVEKHLAQYLEVRRVKREIARLRPGWTFEEYPALEQFAKDVLIAKDVLKEIQPTLADIDAIAPRDEPSVRAALYIGVARASTAALRSASTRARNPGDRIAALDRVANLDFLASLDVRDNSDAFAARDALAARDASTVIHALKHLADLTSRNAIHALATRYAGDARARPDALRRIAAWCIHAHASDGGPFDLSHITTTWFGARAEAVKAWSRPLFEAYIAGAWTIHWTWDTLFWVAKPRVYFELPPGWRPPVLAYPDGRTLEWPEEGSPGPSLHRADGPAVESDVENLYFWHGVLVPAFVVTQPDRITLDHIRSEENAEVRRVMVERYGHSRYLLDSKAEIIHQDEFGTLYRAPLEGDEPLVMVRVVNSTPEPDGSHKEYFLRVPRTMKRAREAIAWTFGLKEMEYTPEAQT